MPDHVLGFACSGSHARGANPEFTPYPALEAVAALLKALGAVEADANAEALVGRGGGGDGLLQRAYHGGDRDDRPMRRGAAAGRGGNGDGNDDDDMDGSNDDNDEDDEDDVDEDGEQYATAWFRRSLRSVLSSASRAATTPHERRWQWRWWWQQQQRPRHPGGGSALTPVLLKKGAFLVKVLLDSLEDYATVLDEPYGDAPTSPTHGGRAKKKSRKEAVV